MKDYFKKWWDDVISEIKSYPANYILLATILILALFVRVYRTEDLLGFYYDQGRDAKVIWRLWHEGRPFLIGPVTGLQGIFLGPFYYYLIAPFYLISGGNPALPAYFLAFLVTLGIFMLYLLGTKMQGKAAGLIAVTIGAFSLELVKAGRWLANPTPIFFTSMVLLWSMWETVQGKSKKWWLMIALIIGVSLQLEAASAIFYLPMIFVFAFWQKKNLPDKKTLLISVGILLLTFIPQIAFNFRHDNILLDNFIKMLVEEKSFKLNFWNVLSTRMKFFWNVYHTKIIPEKQTLVAFFTTISLIALFKEKKGQFRKKIWPLFAIFFGVPMVGYILFQGNLGNIYDYYMTGYYLPLILFLSLGLGKLWRNKLGQIVVILFFLQFLLSNIPLIRYFIIAGVDGPEHITLGNELQAVEWVFENANNRGEFNVDVYVPPVIPHSYDYLFLWQATKRCGDSLCQMNKDEQVPLLYTLYEVDPPHPWRLEAWLERQDGIGVVEEEHKFGGITIQRRRRL